MTAHRPAITVELALADGDRFEAGDTLATVSGPARAVLQAERVALNFVQRMSGIATLTGALRRRGRRTRAPASSTPARPHRACARSNVTPCGRGGGHNHRFSLSDAVMAKDNHLAVLDRTVGADRDGCAARRPRAALAHDAPRGRGRPASTRSTPVLAAGVDTIMLDNFTVDELREGVALIDGRAIVEASGDVNLDTVAPSPRPGVDVISVGALTHSVRVARPRARRRSWTTARADDLPRRGGHHPRAPGGARGDVAVPDRRLRQPVEPPHGRRVRRPCAGGCAGTVAAWLGCRPAEVTFTSGGTEADNLAIKGIALGEPARPAHRHDADRARGGARVGRLPACGMHGFEVDAGRRSTRTGWSRPHDARARRSAPTRRSSACSTPTTRSARFSRSPSSPRSPTRTASRSTPTPCRPPAGSTSTSSALGVDALSVSGHKLGAPKGIGALVRARAHPDRAAAARRRPGARAPVGHRERGRRRRAGDGGSPRRRGPARRMPPRAAAARDGFIAACSARSRMPCSPVIRPRGCPARLVRVPGHQRRGGAARTGAARRGLLERLGLRGRQRRAVARAARARLPRRRRPHGGALLLGSG